MLLSPTGEAASAISIVAHEPGASLLPFGASVSNGSFIVGWQQEGTILIRPFQGAATTTITSNAILPQISGTFVSWRGLTVVGRRLENITEQVIIRGPADQLVGGLAGDGVEALAAWTEEGRVRIGRVTMDGMHPDGAGRLVSDSARLQSSPHVAFDGTDYLIV